MEGLSWAGCPAQAALSEPSAASFPVTIGSNVDQEFHGAGLISGLLERLGQHIQTEGGGNHGNGMDRRRQFSNREDWV